MSPKAIARLLAVATLISALACQSSTEPGAANDRVAAAAEFNRLGDSVIASGGAETDAAPFYGAASIVARSPDLTRIVVAIDGVPTKMIAIATAVEVGRGPMIMCPMPALATADAAAYVCPWGVPIVTKTLFAWEPGRPRRVLTLIASTDYGPIGTPVPTPLARLPEMLSDTASAGGTVGGTVRPDTGRVAGGVGVSVPVDSTTGTNAARFAPMPAHLEFTDARGNVFWGIKGSQRSAVNVSDRECTPVPYAVEGDTRIAIYPRADCHIAQFTFKFEAVVAAPPWLAASAAAATRARMHTLTLGETTLAGTYITEGMWIAVDPPVP